MKKVNKKNSWEQCKYEIAKDFLTAICKRIYMDESSAEYCYKKSLYFVDSIIKELKNPKN